MAYDDVEIISSKTYLTPWHMYRYKTLIKQRHNSSLTHWGPVTHIYVSKLTVIGSDNGLSPSRRQAIIWTNAGILLIRPPGTNFNEIFIEIHIFSFKKIHLKMLSGKWRPFCLSLNVLTHKRLETHACLAVWCKTKFGSQNFGYQNR